MSVKKHTFLEITKHLKTKVPTIKYIDKYRGQLDNVRNWVFPRPAVFLSYGRTDWNNISMGGQLGDAVIRVRIVVENYADAYEGSINQQKALEFFDINEKVHQALQNLSGTFFKNMSRVVDEDDEDHGNLIVTIFEYSCKMVDDSSADTNENRVEVEPDLTVEYVNKKNFPKVSGKGDFIIDM